MVEELSFSPTEGILGKKGKLSYKVDVLLYQSLVRQDDRQEVLDRYGNPTRYLESLNNALSGLCGSFSWNRLLLSIAIMRATLHNANDVCIYSVDKTVAIIDPSAPIRRKVSR